GTRHGAVAANAARNGARDAGEVPTVLAMIAVVTVLAATERPLQLVDAVGSEIEPHAGLPAPAERLVEAHDRVQACDLIAQDREARAEQRVLCVQHRLVRRRADLIAQLRETKAL